MARGAARDEHPLVAFGGQVRGRGASSLVGEIVWRSAKRMASMSFYQSVHMLGTHVIFLSEWMGGSSVRNLSIGV